MVDSLEPRTCARCYSGGYLTEDTANKARAIIALQAARPGLDRIRPEKVEALPTIGALVGECSTTEKPRGGDRLMTISPTLESAPRAPPRSPQADASIDVDFLDRMITDPRSPPRSAPERAR